ISKLESRLPHVLVETQFLGMPVWQWIAVIVLYPVALAAAWLVMLVLKLVGYPLIWFVARARNKSPSRPLLLARPGPVTLFVMPYLHYELVEAVGIPLLYRQYYRHVVGIPVAIGFCWLLYRLTDFSVSKLIGHLKGSRLAAANSILLLGRRVIKVGFF